MPGARAPTTSSVSAGTLERERDGDGPYLDMESRIELYVYEWRREFGWMRKIWWSSSIWLKTLKKDSSYFWHGRCQIWVGKAHQNNFRTLGFYGQTSEKAHTRLQKNLRRESWTHAKLNGVWHADKLGKAGKGQTRPKTGLSKHPAEIQVLQNWAASWNWDKLGLDWTFEFKPEIGQSRPEQAETGCRTEIQSMILKLKSEIRWHLGFSPKFWAFSDFRLDFWSFKPEDLWIPKPAHFLKTKPFTNMTYFCCHNNKNNNALRHRKWSSIDIKSKWRAHGAIMGSHKSRAYRKVPRRTEGERKVTLIHIATLLKALRSGRMEGRRSFTILGNWSFFWRLRRRLPSGRFYGNTCSCQHISFFAHRSASVILGEDVSGAATAAIIPELLAPGNQRFWRSPRSFWRLLEDSEGFKGFRRPYILVWWLKKKCGLQFSLLHVSL